jgi:hypothetical protein
MPTYPPYALVFNNIEDSNSSFKSSSTSSSSSNSNSSFNSSFDKKPYFLYKDTSNSNFNFKDESLLSLSLSRSLSLSPIPPLSANTTKSTSPSLNKEHIIAA